MDLFPGALIFASFFAAGGLNRLAVDRQVLDIHEVLADVFAAALPD